MRPQPLISVRDVEASSRWYQRLLGARSDHGGPDYERLVAPARKGTPARLILQLHAWEVDHDHGAIGDEGKPHGNGVLLWFELDDFDGAVARAGEMKAEILKPRHRSENAHWEHWLRDPEGYTVVLASPHGSAQ